jgi:Iap family predicted aminopeptidase
MKRLLLLLVSVLVLALLLVPTAAQAKPSFDQALDQVFAQGYPQTVDSYVASLGTNPQLGFRWAGTSADNASARYLAEQMRAVGLTNVRLEPIPVDVFEFKSASVTVGERAMTASSFAGIPPTPSQGVGAQIVYAHDGTKHDFDALQAAGISVKGKLVLIDTNFPFWWLNFPAAEATYRGAVGCIFTYGPNSGKFYAVAPDALGSYDGLYNLSFVPAVYIAKQDGDWLKGQLTTQGAGPVATMKLMEKVRMAKDGGVGYNVIGDLAGTTHDGTFTLFLAHHDAHFHAATDDADGDATELAIAKAMVQSGYRPQHTVRFMFTTGEEFGRANAMFDWVTGSWWAITRLHADWVGHIRACLSLDHMSGHGSPLGIHTSADLAPWLSGEAAAAGSLLPYGFVVKPQNAATDAFQTALAGVPSVNFDARGGADEFGVYHTQYMTANLIDWPAVNGIAKYLFRVQNDADSGLLPYGLESLADDLAAAVSPADLLNAGADSGAVSRFQKALVRFQAAAAQYEAGKDSIPTRAYPLANTALLQVERLLNSNLTSVDNPVAFDTLYPHQQVFGDVQYLNQTIAALQQAQPDTAAALKALGNAGTFTPFGLDLSHSVYQFELTQVAPHYSGLTWGAECHLAPWIDVIPQYDAIQAGTWGAHTVAQLKAMRNMDLRVLNSRLNDITATADEATGVIRLINMLN